MITVRFPNGHAVPCRVYNPIANVPKEELIEIKKELQSIKRKLKK